MRKYFITLLSFVLINSGFAQQAANQDVAVKNNGQSIDKSMVSGHFDVPVPGKEGRGDEHVNVNYLLSPAPFSNTLSFELSTPDPVIFRIDIVNTNGKKLTQWKASEAAHRHNGQVDISKLEPGNYAVNIYWERSKGLLHSIPFQKVAK